MSEQHDLTHLHVQRKLRPKPEDVIPLVVDEDKQQTALDFFVWLRENKMPIGWSGVHNTWDIKYKGRLFGKIRIGGVGTGIQTHVQWSCAPYLWNFEKYENSIVSENLQDFVWDNVVFCKNAFKIGRPASAPKIKHLTTWTCNRDCVGETVTICNKVFENRCCSPHFRYCWFTNPNEAEVAALKRLLELEKQAQYEINEQTKRVKAKMEIKVNKLTGGVKFHENFANFDPAKCKAAEMLPLHEGVHGTNQELQFNGVPQILKVCEHDGVKCLYIETEETPRNKRRGFLVAEGIEMDGELAVEVKVKPIDGLEGVFEVWLLGDNGVYLCLELGSSHKGKFSLIAMRSQMENGKRRNYVAASKYRPKFIFNEWYYLHIQLRKDKINMAILDANRASVDRRTFDTPAGFNSFDIALAHSLGPRTKDMYYFKALVESVIVADYGYQDLGE
ncbi:MAG: hypothetical protein FWC32_04505 [Firmicutes bacterium]|nr:hypothetical protein [Bacillota bacterium]